MKILKFGEIEKLNDFKNYVLGFLDVTHDQTKPPKQIFFVEKKQILTQICKRRTKNMTRG